MRQTAMADPVRPSTLPDPATTYQEAMERYRRLQGFDGPYVDPECRTQLLTHGTRQPRVVVLLHGITNCPRQFVAFAPLLFKEGYNVLIPRMPRNGYRDQATKDIVRITPDELQAYCHEVIDIAAGLGERVTIFGLSAGGTLAAWMAAQRGEVERAVIAAPLLGLLGILGPRFCLVGTGFVAGMLSLSPNVTLKFPEKLPHGYIGFQTRSIGQVLWLANAILVAAKDQPPAARSILFITSATDTAVNNDVVRLLARRWRARGAAIESFDFPKADRVYHDLIDPQQKEQQIDFVYPILLKAIADG